jgi:ATP-dependent RNA helicase TDRD9
MSHLSHNSLNHLLPTAISIARRVALERRCDVGTLVGYQVGLDKQMDSKTNSDTRILFCTTGVLLQKLLHEKTMKRYSHVILDEVHERDIDFDLLLVVVRRLLIDKNQYVKIVLMSATLNAEKMANYFKSYDKEAPILNLEIPRPFKILITYLDQLEGAGIGVKREVIKPEVPGISSEMYKIGMKMMAMVTAKSRGKFKPSFLVFLPGIQEIKRFQALLYKPHEDFNVAEFELSILHSSIPVENYGKAFDGTVENKIILATNIAESSVTLPGVRFVIDFCLTKYQETDTATNMTQLKLDWASKMSLEQRAGRVGRIENGQVIRLIFKDHFMSLADETKPEIQRASLESVVLKTKILDMGKPSDILALALDPPKRSSIIDSILVLKELGGMTRMSKRKKFENNDGELTFTGAVMGKLPVDVRVSKLIVLGHVFSCLKECIIIGAALSSKSIFKFISPSVEHKIQEFNQRLETAKGSGSDLIAMLNAYNEWRGAINRGLKGTAEKMWCDQQCLDLKNLRDMHDLVEDLKKRLLNLCLKESDDNVRYTREEKMFAIKICIGGAFYPNYYEFGGSPPRRDSYSVLNNMNPCNSVYLKGMESKRLAQIYEEQVRRNLCEAGVTYDINEMQVKFDSNSTRVCVQFKSICDEDIDFQPGEVRLEVYKAVKLGKLRRSMELNIMSYQDEIQYAEHMKLGTFRNQHFTWRKKMLKASSHCIYPKLYHREVPGRVTHVSN